MAKKRYRPKLLGGGSAAYKLVWRGAEVYQRAVEDAGFIMGKQMLLAETIAKNRLFPNHGIDTSTMHNRTHVNTADYNWQGNHIEPVQGGGAVLGGKLIIPSWDGRGRIRLVLGTTQKYGIFYHQRFDPFLLIGFMEAMRAYKDELQKTWRKSFK